MTTTSPHHLHRRGAGVDDKFEEYKWFTICECEFVASKQPSALSLTSSHQGTVLALFGLGFLGFAVSELWAARIRAKMLDNKIMKSATGRAKKNFEYKERVERLKEIGVNGDAAKKMFQQQGFDDVAAMRKM